MELVNVWNSHGKIMFRKKRRRSEEQKKKKKEKYADAASRTGMICNDQTALLLVTPDL